MHNYCCIPECNSIRRDVKFHVFPCVDSNRSNKWLDCINSEVLRALSVDELKKCYVCHKHFEKRFVTAKSRLLSGAYPTLFTNAEISSGIPSIRKQETEPLTEHSYSRKRHHDHTYSKDPYLPLGTSQQACHLPDRDITEPPTSRARVTGENTPENTPLALASGEISPPPFASPPASPRAPSPTLLSPTPSADATEDDASSEELPLAILPTNSQIIVLSYQPLETLVRDHATIKIHSCDINQELANHFNDIATQGMKKDERKKLIDKYLIPANCVYVGAPQLNPEIKEAIPKTVVKRDKAIKARQTEIAAAISCIGRCVSTLLDEKNKKDELLNHLMDSGRILCDIQYNESISRRKFVLQSLKKPDTKEMKEQLTKAKLDTLLFGEDLSETLQKKSVTKSSVDLDESEA